MNLLQLKEHVDNAIVCAIEHGEKAEDVIVSLQIDRDNKDSVHSCEHVELHYDGNAFASGCVLTAWIGKEPK